jgi:hypothetical protein
MIVKEELITKIVAMEWNMFQNVANIGGRAACQNDFDTFSIMRSSQAIAWSEATLASYLEDLAEAQENGRNLLTEKYARMMEFTAPLEYARIQHHLPPLEQETLLLIDRIAQINLAWEEEIKARFPYIRQRGRPASSSDDAPHITSIETYLRGELATYSPRTLALYYQNALEQKASNINGAQIVLAATMQRYGFNSLAAANAAMRMKFS